MTGSIAPWTGRKSIAQTTPSCAAFAWKPRLSSQRRASPEAFLASQLTAFATSALIAASSTAVKSFTAKAVGPHGRCVVEVRLVLETERRIPRLELRRGLEEADDLAVPGIRGHPVPSSRHQSRGAGFDDRMEPLAQDAICFGHFWRFCTKHGSFPACTPTAASPPSALWDAASFIAARSSGVNPFGRFAQPGDLGRLLRASLHVGESHWSFLCGHLRLLSNSVSLAERSAQLGNHE